MKMNTTETSGSSSPRTLKQVKASLISHRKFKEALEMYRAKEIKAVPIKVFDVSEITQAYRYFSSRGRIGKVVISLQNSKSIIRVSFLRFRR